MHWRFEKRMLKKMKSIFKLLLPLLLAISLILQACASKQKECWVPKLSLEFSIAYFKDALSENSKSSKIPEGYKVMRESFKYKGKLVKNDYCVKMPFLISGNTVKKAYPESEDGKLFLRVELNEDAARKLERLTTEIVEQSKGSLPKEAPHLAIIMGGKLISAPNVISPISKSVVLIQDCDWEQISEIAKALNSQSAQE